MAYSVTKGVIKIPSAGDFFTMVVKKCEVVDSQFKNDDGSFKEEVKFTDPRGDAIFIPRKTADFQLGKWCGFGEQNPDGSWNIGYGDVDGHSLTFRRDPNEKFPSKPYYGIRKADESEDVSHRPSLVQAAKEQAERVRKARGLPADGDGSLGPYIPGLDAPPPTDEDYPYADGDGMPPQKVPPAASTLTEEQANKEGAINAAYARAYAFVLGVQGPVATPDSLQAGTATLLIQYSRAGIC